MEFGKRNYALQRKVMKLRKKDGISLKKAWAKVLRGRKALKRSPKRSPKRAPKRAPRKSPKRAPRRAPMGPRAPRKSRCGHLKPCDSMLYTRDKMTCECRLKKTLAPPISLLRDIAINNGISPYEKHNGVPTKILLNKPALKGRLARAGVDYPRIRFPNVPEMKAMEDIQLEEMSVQPILLNEAPPSDMMVFNEFGKKKCNKNQYRNPVTNLCRLRTSRPCNHEGQHRSHKTGNCSYSDVVTASDLVLMAAANGVPYTKKKKDGTYSKTVVNKSQLKSRLTRANVKYPGGPM